MKPIRLLSFFALALVLLAGALPSAGAEEKPLILTEALSLALEGNLEVLSAREERAKAEGLYRAARSGLLPAIGVNAAHTRQHETTSRPDEETTAQIGLSQWVYAGGVVRAGERQALANLERADLTARETEESVALKVYDAFCTVLLAQADLETAREALTYAEGFLKELQKRREVGLSTNLDVNRAEQQAARSRADLIRAQNGLDRARIDLFTLIRLDPQEERTVSGDLEMEPYRGDRQASITRALSRRADLARLRVDRAIQADEIEIAKGGLRPTAKLNAGYGVKDNPRGAEDDEWTVSLNVDIPLFDGGLTKGKVEQARAGLRQLEQGVTEKEEAIRSEISQACLDLESASAIVDVARRNVEIAVESLRLAEVGYREGVNVQLDVLDARTSLTEARQELASALKNYRLYRARLWRAEGSLRENVLDR